MTILQSTAKLNLAEKIRKISFIERLIQLYIFLLPWQALYIFAEKFWEGSKWQYGTGVIYATEILLWLILLTFFGNKKNRLSPFTLSQFKNIFSRVNIKSLIVLAIWSLLVWSGLSILWAPDKSAAFYLWFKILELVTLFFVILNSKIAIEKLLWPLALSAGVQGIIAGWQFTEQYIGASTLFGMAEHLAGTYGGIVIETATGRWLRAYGTFVHPNILGGFCSLGLLATLLLAQKRKKFFWLNVLSIFVTAGLFLSFSRSAWLATSSAIIFLAIYNLKNKSIRVFITSLLPALLTTIILAIIFYPLIFTRADFSNRLERQSIGQRVSQAGQAWQMIQARPLLGVGISNYTLNLKYLNPTAYTFELQPAHNIYLLIASEVGLIGLLLFVSSIILILIFSTQQKSTMYLCLPLTLLIIGIFDHYLVTQYVGLAMIALSLTFTATNYKIDANVEH